MFSKKLAVIFTVLMLLFLAGCSSGGDETPQSTSQFVGGTSGVAIDFVEGTPPAEVLDTNQPFGISIKLSNQGEFDIDEPATVMVSLTGFDPADFGVTSQADMEQPSPEPLLGASKDANGNQVQGTVVTMDFPANGGSFEHQTEIAGSVTYNIKADVCYGYGSTANAKLCVLEDILGTTGGTPFCEINEQKTVDKSGAPVQISSFIESVSSANKVAFVFKVSHIGTAGDIFQLASDCDPDFSMKNKVHVKVDTGIADGLTCSGLQNGAASGSVYEGDATLLNGEREIRCTQTINEPYDLEKLVRIDLTYDYKTAVTKSLQVKHLGN